MISQGADTLTVGYASSKGRLAALQAPSGRQLAVYFARAFYHDSGGSPASGRVGICRLLAEETLNLYKFDGTNYTEQDFAVAAATELMTDTGGHGFAVQAKRKFGIIGMNVDGAGTGTLAPKYWDGDSWNALTVVEAISVASTGITYLVFLPPADWEVGGHDDLDSNKYSIQVTCAAGLSAAATIDDIWVASWIEYYEAIAANTGVAVQFYENRPLILDAGEGIMPYYELATTENGITIGYSTI